MGRIRNSQFRQLPPGSQLRMGGVLSRNGHGGHLLNEMQSIGFTTPKEKEVIWKMTRQSSDREDGARRDIEAHRLKLVKLPARIGNSGIRNFAN